MLKTLMLSATLSVLFLATAFAQTPGATDVGGRSSSAGARGGNITSTGETMPNPGASQSGGTTPMDRGVQQQDNKIESGICKGC